VVGDPFGVKPPPPSGDVVLAVDGQQVAKPADIKVRAMYSTMTGYGLLTRRMAQSAKDKATMAIPAVVMPFQP
jgi:hypothetical protein